MAHPSIIIMTCIYTPSSVYFLSLFWSLKIVLYKSEKEEETRCKNKQNEHATALMKKIVTFSGSVDTAFLHAYINGRKDKVAVG